MKKISLAVFAVMMVAMLALFTGCGSSSNTTSGDSSATTADQSLQKVKDKGTFVLGLDDSFPPMGFRDENNCNQTDLQKERHTVGIYPACKYCGGGAICFSYKLCFY